LATVRYTATWRWFRSAQGCQQNLGIPLVKLSQQLGARDPERIITRRQRRIEADQTDQDSLPPYDVLDGIMACYVEKNLPIAEIVAGGYAEADVQRVVKLIRINEYKRRQAPVGVRITDCGFGKMAHRSRALPRRFLVRYTCIIIYFGAT